MSRKLGIAGALVGVILMSWSPATAEIAKIKKSIDSKGILHIFNEAEGKATKPGTPPGATGSQASPPAVASPQIPALPMQPRIEVAGSEVEPTETPPPGLASELEPPQTEAPPLPPEGEVEFDAKRSFSDSTSPDDRLRN